MPAPVRLNDQSGGFTPVIANLEFPQPLISDFFLQRETTGALEPVFLWGLSVNLSCGLAR